MPIVVPLDVVSDPYTFTFIPEGGGVYVPDDDTTEPGRALVPPTGTGYVCVAGL